MKGRLVSVVAGGLSGALLRVLPVRREGHSVAATAAGHEDPGGRSGGVPGREET
ncbi:MAG TPA: hypothetical protein VE173_14440 [Longimicrobiales bacterium]|nr:hypothetical protein [Longimicrobiales bacterium]